MKTIFEELRKEYLCDPIVHHGLSLYRCGRMEEREALIEIVKFLSLGNSKEEEEEETKLPMDFLGQLFTPSGDSDDVE